MIISIRRISANKIGIPPSFKVQQILSKNQLLHKQLQLKCWLKAAQRLSPTAKEKWINWFLVDGTFTPPSPRPFEAMVLTVEGRPGIGDCKLGHCWFSSFQLLNLLKCRYLLVVSRNSQNISSKQVNLLILWYNFILTLAVVECFPPRSRWSIILYQSQRGWNIVPPTPHHPGTSIIPPCLAHLSPVRHWKATHLTGSTRHSRTLNVVDLTL